MSEAPYENLCSAVFTQELDERRGKQFSDLIERVSSSEISSIQSVVSGIVEIINDPDSSAKDLKDLIEIDPPLTAKVLKVSNSALYASRKQITSIEEAVIWIGFDALKELALNQKVCEVFEKAFTHHGYSRAKLWKHSVSAAVLAKMIYRREFAERGENAYVAGLLHDIGIIVLDQFLQGEFKIILDGMKSGSRNLYEVERLILGFDHTAIGSGIAAEWKFPAELILAIGYHHFPASAPEQVAKLARVLYISDFLCHQNNVGFSDLTNPQTEPYAECINFLGLKPRALHLLAKEMMQEIARMESSGFLINEA